MRWLWLPVLALVAVAAISAAVDGSYWLAAGYAVAGIALTYWLMPWRSGPSVRQSDLESLPAQDRRLVIYWRPGCPYCLRLRTTLGRSGRRALWLNIWQDADAASFVRSVNDGNETVPTVVIDGVPHTNPDPAEVRVQLARSQR